jgi:hypothetical protein
VNEKVGLVKVESEHLAVKSGVRHNSGKQVKKKRVKSEEEIEKENSQLDNLFLTLTEELTNTHSLKTHPNKPNHSSLLQLHS